MEPTDIQPQEEHPAPSPERPRRRSSRRNGHDHIEAGLRSLRDALRAARQGDFSVRLPTDGAGEGVFAEVALAFNALVEENKSLVEELARVSRVVGDKGVLTERASLGAVSGSWAVGVDSVNSLLDSMAFPTMEATRTLSRVADGDLSMDMSEHVDGQPLQGEFLRLGTTVNSLVGRLRTVARGVSRGVREMGTEGKLRLQAT